MKGESKKGKEILLQRENFSNLMRQAKIQIDSKDYNLKELIRLLYKSPFKGKKFLPGNLSITIGHEFFHKHHLISFIQVVGKLTDFTPFGNKIINIYISKDNKDDLIFNFISDGDFPNTNRLTIIKTVKSYKDAYQETGEKVVGQEHIGMKMKTEKLFLIPRLTSLHDLLMERGYIIKYIDVSDEEEWRTNLEEEIKKESKKFRSDSTSYGNQYDWFDDAFGDNPESSAGWI